MHLRALIVLLAVMNLGVALWWALRPAPEPEPLPEPPAGASRLLLASEADPQALEAAALAAQSTAVETGAGGADGADETDALADADADPDAEDGSIVAAEQAGSPSESTAATELTCYRLGPWQQQAQVTAARATLQPRVQRIVQREVPVDPSGWRVLLPPLASRDLAQATVARLEASGFNDHFIIGQGAETNAIALGRFTAEERARRHQAALGAAGFNARVEPLGGGEPSLWLDVAALRLDAEAARTATQAEQASEIGCASLQ